MVNTNQGPDLSPGYFTWILPLSPLPNLLGLESPTFYKCGNGGSEAELKLKYTNSQFCALNSEFQRLWLLILLALILVSAPQNQVHTQPINCYK